MKRILLSLLIVMPLALPVTTLPHAASAAYSDHTTTPLMVIRFNQPRVYFQRPLYNAVSKALQAKNTVMFQIINYAPAGAEAKADRDLQAVLASLNQMGVPPSRIAVSNQEDPSLRFSEVHLYVR
jgi:hypothetical protein